ncbi:hypothetical protein Dacet_2834 [Denitrovibrio acetiphilus DSM 12809]|uniref:Uncharacterized protein n=1 Tax=Denitrovibrio acetiphilus (strain DSM 12809 / NBRC 114555 / N2460) TaxID=522772 RepID=D4H6B0_DENA2|nr:hypothetical protein [Denitrovibrio acetiphilus]ADD69584.1 hypothetical protein Dacet_2834 [Denitrovibrio acetiphilus DSM 12809]
MNPLISYMTHKPFFGMCFIFQTIPFWVPLIGIIFGSDPVLMILSLLLIVFAKAYIDSEITFTNPVGQMFSYLVKVPLISFSKFTLAALVLSVLLYYGMNGAPIDRGVAAVLVIFTLKVIYFRPAKSGFWNVRGLTIYKLIGFSGKLLSAFLWLSFFMVDVSIPEKIIICLTAMLVSALTFFKTNEGLI